MADEGIHRGIDTHASACDTLNRDDAGMYSFAFDEQSGRCVAHGASPDFVGMSLGEICASTHNSELDGDLLQVTSYKIQTTR